MAQRLLSRLRPSKLLAGFVVVFLFLIYLLATQLPRDLRVPGETLPAVVKNAEREPDHGAVSQKEGPRSRQELVLELTPPRLRLQELSIKSGRSEPKNDPSAHKGQPLDSNAVVISERKTALDSVRRRRMVGVRGVDRLSDLSSIDKKGRPSAAKSGSNKKARSKTQSNWSPITEQMSLMIEKHLKAMANQSLAMIEGFDREHYLAPQRMKKGDGDPMKRFGFNQIASDSTPCYRPLQDFRSPGCWKRHTNLTIRSLPKASVIICFHNEARSALLRTIVSVLSRSPPNLLKELVLVDDFSDDIQDGELLAAISKVRVIRLQRRQGLIRARLAGVQAAKGEVLVFLDSHCEVTTGWLEPLLARIKENETHVVSPVIDIINKDTMMYTPANINIKGGFSTHLNFIWEVLSKEETLERKDNSARPIRTAAIAGGLFAVSKKYFEYLGTYDSEMEIWGGENIEMSVRVWMCGGVLEIIPCSRVGHIFRSVMPYGFGLGNNYHNTVSRNLRRLADVWLGVYKEIFYRSTPYARTVPVGNISDRVKLKQQLQCKSFKWFLDNIYPEFKVHVPPEKHLIPRQLQQGSLCLQRGQTDEDQVTLANCDPTLHEDSDQAWLYTEDDTLRYHDKCLTVREKQFIMSHCSNAAIYRNSQIFQMDPLDKTEQFLLKHKQRGLCITSNHHTVPPTLYLHTCARDEQSTQWQFIT